MLTQPLIFKCLVAYLYLTGDMLSFRTRFVLES